MVLLKYISVLNLYSNLNIDYHKRSHSWYALDFYQASQLEIRLNKNTTQAFCFGLKFWPQLEINETPTFRKQAHYGIKLEGSGHNLRNTFIV